MRILILISSLFYFSLSQFKAQNNNIVVIHEGGKKFTLFINDAKINGEPQSNVKAFALTEGMQKIRIEFEDAQKPLVDSVKIKPIEKNRSREFTYAIRENGKNGQVARALVFVGSSELSGPEIPVVPEPPVYVEVKDNKLYGNLYKAKDDKPIFFENYNTETGVCAVKLDDKEIEYAINLINKTNDNELRYKYIEAMVVKNCYYTSQLLLVLGKLDSEMDKLKLSKSAFTHLLDPASAGKILDLFKYQTFKDDYATFLKERSNISHQEKLNCTVPIGDSEFSSIYKEITKGQYEYDKLRIAKKQVTNNCMSTEQIKKVIVLFTHDREKLEFSKAAYNIVTDKSNFSSLETVFQFTESKADFKKILSK